MLAVLAPMPLAIGLSRTGECWGGFLGGVMGKSDCLAANDD
jgi:hypothetical protein